MRKLGEDFGIPELLKDAPKVDAETERIRNEIFDANRTAAKIFMQNLENAPEALEYLRKRGVSDEMKKRFAIGFIGDGDKFIEQLRNHFCILLYSNTAGECSLHSTFRTTRHTDSIHRA